MGVADARARTHARAVTQVVEQANAGLGRLKHSLAYMAPDNFMRHAMLYLAMRNIQKKQF